MRPGARVAAAIKVFEAAGDGRLPVGEALKDWGRAHRFAGSKDRAAIAGLAYDMLRRRASAGAVMADDSSRGVALGTLRLARDMDADAIAALFDGDTHAPPALSDAERRRIGAGLPDDAPPHVRGDYPEWLHASLARVSDDPAAEGRALAERAPVDLRVNTLKAEVERANRALPKPAEPTPHAPHGLRLPPPANGARAPDVQSSTAWAKGWVEVQDEGSQIAALLSGAAAGEQVLDLCAGAGGKTLALAAMMGNKGQVHAYDMAPRRLAPIHDRLARSGARNVQVRQPRGEGDLADLEGRLDLVFVDAPCTGSGTWRRNPDAKWRLREMALEKRREEQATVLDHASRLVKPGGRIAYVTCSILPEENEDQVAALLARDPSLKVADASEAWRRHVGAEVPEGVVAGPYIRLSPLRSGTDGFFVALLDKT